MVTRRLRLLLGLLIFLFFHGHIVSGLEFGFSPSEALFQTPVIASEDRAGAAGASTAYHLARLAGNLGQNVSITIFEKNGYIGGRSTTVNVFDDPRYPVELGAAIFVPANRILVQAAADFGLNTGALREDSDDDDIGIWDGTQFVYTQSAQSSGFWNIINLIRRYGWSPVKSWRLASAASKTFSKLYDEPIFPYPDLTNATNSLGLTDITKIPADIYLKQNGVSDVFAHDFIQAATRVNYAQNLNSIHALESLVSLYGARGGTAVIGGNWQIFKEMIIASGAKLHLNTAVLSINQVHTYGRDRITWQVAYPDESKPMSLNIQHFDAVVIAAPYHQANMSIDAKPPVAIREVPYMTLQVTFVVTKAPLNCAYFNLTENTCPTAVITTLPEDLKDTPIFNSISRVLRLPSGASVWKIFSPEVFTDEILEQFFPGALREWIYRKEWKAYPRLDPIETFAPIELFPDIDSYGLWYTSGIESFISTMETSAMSGRNVAALITQRIFGNRTSSGS